MAQKWDFADKTHLREGQSKGYLVKIFKVPGIPNFFDGWGGGSTRIMGQPWNRQNRAVIGSPMART